MLYDVLGGSATPTLAWSTRPEQQTLQAASLGIFPKQPFGKFAEPDVLKPEEFDRLLVVLGVSSPPLNDHPRGFHMFSNVPCNDEPTGRDYRSRPVESGYVRLLGRSATMGTMR